jgi:biotin carboxylase
MQQILRDNGLPCARHALVSERKAALAFARDCGYPLVAKPPAGAGARNTVRVESDAELEGYLNTQPPTADAPVLLEEFIRGREHSFDSVTLDRRHLFHSISSYHPSPLEVVESPWIQWCVLLPRHIDGPEFADMAETGRRALEVLGMVTGMTHMEWFRRADGSLAISEVAARPPGAQFTSLISWAHDLDFYRAWARLLVDEAFEPPARKYACGAAYLRGQSVPGHQGAPGKVVDVRGIEEVLRELGALVVEKKLPQAGQAASGTYEGEGYVILRHPDTAVVSRGLDRIVEGIRVVLG